MIIPEAIDLECAQLMQELYNLKPGGSDNGPFNFVLREATDYGINVGILEDEKFIFMIFRGSVTQEDWARDAVSFLPETLPGVGTFPLGFSQGLEECRSTLYQYIRNAKPVILVGHSLGAAHAGIMGQIMTRDGGTPARTVLMGCPNLVPDSAKGELINAGPVINYKNGDDFVTDVPPIDWTQIAPFEHIDGGHDDWPNFFMYHHVNLYVTGISNILETV